MAEYEERDASAAIAKLIGNDLGVTSVKLFFRPTQASSYRLEVFYTSGGLQYWMESEYEVLDVERIASHARLFISNPANRAFNLESKQ